MVGFRFFQRIELFSTQYCFAQPNLRGDAIANALIIVEVLSKSTRDYDRTDKFKFYRSIPDFKEYVLIDQYRYYVEQFYQQDNGEWLFKVYELDKDVLRFHSVDFQI